MEMRGLFILRTPTEIILIPKNVMDGAAVFDYHRVNTKSDMVGGTTE